MSWIDAGSELEAGTSRVVRAGREQAALFRLADGRYFAVDNRCPHEGYPLQQGDVRDTTLTCAWHNFKFNLCDGACLMGDEAVRTHPVRVVDGRVEVLLAPADLSAQVPAWTASLQHALANNRTGQIARDLVRLLDAGVPPAELAALGAVWDCDHGEYGPSHALALLPDALTWVPGHPGLDAARPLVLGLEMAAEACVRLPARARPAPVPGATRESLRAAVEAEDRDRAEGLLRGALADGVPLATLQGWLYAVVADHFLDFGHALLYQNKVFELLAQVSPEHADALLGGHLFGIVNGTREDTLPPWATWRKRVAGVDLAALERRPRGGALALEAFVDSTPAEVLEAVLHSDAPAQDILAALAEAASTRLLRFDLAVVEDPDLQDDWLDVTHRLTVAESTWTAFDRWDDPDRWKLVLQLAWFVARATAYDGPATVAVPGPPLREAIVAGNAAAALAAVDTLPPLETAATLRALAIEDRAARPIVVAHAMKTALAAQRVYERTGSLTPLRAVARWFASPLHERRSQRRVSHAIRLVTEGKPPVRRVT